MHDLILCPGHRPMREHHLATPFLIICALICVLTVLEKILSFLIDSTLVDVCGIKILIGLVGIRCDIYGFGIEPSSGVIFEFSTEKFLKYGFLPCVAMFTLVVRGCCGLQIYLEHAFILVFCH